MKYLHCAGVSSVVSGPEKKYEEKGRQRWEKKIGKHDGRARVLLFMYRELYPGQPLCRINMISIECKYQVLVVRQFRRVCI